MFHTDRCIRCGDCLVRCPQVADDRPQAVREITALIAGQEAAILVACVTCMACNEYCRQGAQPYDLILQRQEERGFLPVPPESLERFRGQTAAPSQVTEGEPGRPAISFCGLKGLFPEEAFQGDLFQGLTALTGGDYFCATVYLHAARESLFRQRLPLLVRNLSALNAEAVVLTHNDCYAALTVKAREYEIAVPFRPVLLAEYLLETLKGLAGRLTPLDRKIAFQRPCISRYLPEEEPLLDELFALLGVERIPRRYDRQDALCCGGAFIDQDREKALRLQDRNLTDAVGHGADAMVMLCPLCWVRLSGPCRERGLPPIHLAALCRMALGEIPFPSR